MKRETQSVPEGSALVDSDQPMSVGAWVEAATDLPAMHEWVLVWPKRGMGWRTEKFDRTTHEFVDGWEWESDGEGFQTETVTHWARIVAPGERNQKPSQRRHAAQGPRSVGPNVREARRRK